jgi:hypothetical protein
VIITGASARDYGFPRQECLYRVISVTGDGHGIEIALPQLFLCDTL